MKRLIVSFALAVGVALPLATPAAADPPWSREERWGNREERWERREERWDRQPERRDGRNWRGPNRGWDGARHNGYYYNQRWHYGPPPQSYYGDPYFRPGYSAWRRGVMLPPVYRGYAVNDYNRYRLRPPPRGYVWYRVGDSFLLTGGNGMIFEIVPFD